MLFFEYASGIILDTIDVCFVCYAIDKDNGVADLKNDGFAALILELPQTMKTPLLSDTGDADRMVNPIPVSAGLLDLRGPPPPYVQQQQYVQPQQYVQGQPAYVVQPQQQCVQGRFAYVVQNRV